MHPLAPPSPMTAQRRPVTERLAVDPRGVVVAAITVLVAVRTRIVHTLLAFRRDERGQATTEYALVLLAAALVALLVIAWATAGGGAARIARLFDSVIDAVIDRV